MVSGLGKLGLRGEDIFSRCRVSSMEELLEQESVIEVSVPIETLSASSPFD